MGRPALEGRDAGDRKRLGSERELVHEPDEVDEVAACLVAADDRPLTLLLSRVVLNQVRCGLPTAVRFPRPHSADIT